MGRVNHEKEGTLKGGVKGSLKRRVRKVFSKEWLVKGSARSKKGENTYTPKKAVEKDEQEKTNYREVTKHLPKTALRNKKRENQYNKFSITNRKKSKVKRDKEGQQRGKTERAIPKAPSIAEEEKRKLKNHQYKRRTRIPRA